MIEKRSAMDATDAQRVAIHYVTLLKYTLCCFNREVGGNDRHIS